MTFLLQTPKCLAIADIPKDIQENKTFTVKNTKYVVEQINTLNYKTCNDTEDAEPENIQKCYRVRKIE